MNLGELEQNGGIVNGELVKKTGIWKKFNADTGKFEEVEVDFFVKRSSWLEYQSVLKSNEGGIIEAELLSICACIRLGEDGSEQIPYELAEKLEAGLVNVFREGIAEIFTKKN
jgi:hypothetical protein